MSDRATDAAPAPTTTATAPTAAPSAEGQGEDARAATRPDVAALRTQYFVVHATVRRNLEGVSHDESLVNPEPFGNNANWILGHLVDSCNGVLRLLGQPTVLEPAALGRYRRGSDPLLDAGDAVALERLLEAWDDASRRVNVGLKGATGDLLDAPLPEGNPRIGDTIGAALAFLAFHQAYHAGQLGLLRRLLGKSGAIA